MKSIGLVGLGLLGTALADRLLFRGWSVSGFDVDSVRRDEFSQAGGVALSRLAEVASFDVVLLCLPTSQVVVDVVSSLKGELKAGQTIVDTTTGNPADVEPVAAELAAMGVDYLDATVGGSSQQARDGDIIIMCGGEASAFDRCRCLFDDLAKRTFHLGPVGSGSWMKLAVNLVLGLNRAVLGEGLAYAESLGLDPVTTLEVLKSSPAASAVMDTKGWKMLHRDFQPQARLAQHLKDVRVILETGSAAGACLPMSSVHRQLLEKLVDAGMGELDNSVVVQAFRSAE
ncbi:MAG: NAD(P)-dependent oxidoreductase [Rhodopirellula sp.]|nr:NAD(P)-dependent oxidoreductase [Rhodopirellula sp.]